MTRFTEANTSGNIIMDSKKNSLTQLDKTTMSGDYYEKWVAEKDILYISMSTIDQEYLTS